MERELSMPRISDVSDDQMPESLADSVKAQVKTFGHVLNPSRKMAHVPHIALAAGGMGRAFSRTSHVSKRLDHLLNLRVSAIVGCPF